MSAQALRMRASGPAASRTAHKRAGLRPVNVLRVNVFGSSSLVGASPSFERREQLDRLIVSAKKGKGKGGGGGGGGASTKVQESSSASSGSDVDLDKIAKQSETDAESRMQKAIDTVQNNFNTIRTGRANPLILDKVQVMYFDTLTPIRSLASVSVPDASTLRIAPFDRTALRDIEKAILESDLGLNPNNDGEAIRLNFPPMTEERRKDLAKNISKMAEEGKVSVRNVRKDVLKKYVDKYDFPKDQKRDLETKVQKITDSFVKKLDDMSKSKTEEIMKI